MWQMYRVVFRLHSPLHIGWNRIGNVQRTRPYVVGRSLWGALTMRLTRNQAFQQQQSASGTDYQEMGEWVHINLAYTYLYPATRTVSGDYSIAWHWDEQFASRFLGSYASTALTYPAQSASEGTLHEVEFLSPATMDTSELVYLVGYIFTSPNVESVWISTLKDALRRLQLGGERNYGWGRVELVELQDCTSCTKMHLFSQGASLDLKDTRPRLAINTGKKLIAHVNMDIQAQGDIEPLVGREWRSTEAKRNQIGQYVACNGVYFAPGTELLSDATFEVGTYGIWEKVG